MKDSHRLVKRVPLCRGKQRPWFSIRYRFQLTFTIRVALAALIGSVFVVGCQPQAEVLRPPLSFENLCGLTHEQFAGMDEVQVRRWLEEKYGFTPQSRQEENGDLTVIYNEEKSKGDTTAFLRKRHLFRVLRGGLEKGLIFSQVVVSLGPPETVYRYKTSYEKVLYTIGLDYPGLGISVYTNKLASWEEVEHAGSLAVQLKEGMPVNLIDCYTPSTSMDEVLHNMYPSAPKTVDFQMKSRMPWRGFGAWVPLDDIP